MRWGKISKGYLEQYSRWCDSFFEDSHARYLVFHIDRSDLSWKHFKPRKDRRSSNDDKLASAFYQFLLEIFGPLRETKRWSVYPDAGFFSQETVLKRVEFLFNRTYKKAFGPKSSRVIRFARALDSKDEDLIQLVDLLLGTFSWLALSSRPESPPKRAIVDRCGMQLENARVTTRGLAKVTFKKWLPPEEYQFPR